MQSSTNFCSDFESVNASLLHLGGLIGVPHLILFRDLQEVGESFKPRRRARGRHRANLPEGDQKLYELEPEPKPEHEPPKVTIPVIKAKPLRRSTRTRDRKVDYSKYY